MADVKETLLTAEGLKKLEEEFTASTEKTIPILLKIESLLLFLKVILSE